MCIQKLKKRKKLKKFKKKKTKNLYHQKEMIMKLTIVLVKNTNKKEYNLKVEAKKKNP